MEDAGPPDMPPWGLRLCPSQSCLTHLPPPILDPVSLSGNFGEDTTEWPPGGLFPLSG